jgi:hypothetical protein
MKACRTRRSLFRLMPFYRSRLPGVSSEPGHVHRSLGALSPRLRASCSDVPIRPGVKQYGIFAQGAVLRRAAPRRAINLGCGAQRGTPHSMSQLRQRASDCAHARRRGSGRGSADREDVTHLVARLRGAGIEGAGRYSTSSRRASGVRLGLLASAPSARSQRIGVPGSRRARRAAPRRRRRRVHDIGKTDVAGASGMARPPRGRS